MKLSGQILKMITENGNPIQYYLNLSGDLLNMNQLFGKEINIKHIGYECISCKDNKTIYRMGFCKKCFFESPYASKTILHPELSTAHIGIEERNIKVEREIQLVPHIVYLAYTGNVKVGVTRENQIPTRWIDQGATFALPIARTENRYEAGIIEMEIKKYMTDKTNWKKMLQTVDTEIDLLNFREKTKEYFPKEFQKFYSPNEEIYKLKYPYETTNDIKVFTLNKKPEFTGVLKGIKGQYLYFEGGNFINIRGHEGYVISFLAK